jgi:MFS transporter, putative metabolite:H+ symporter
MADPAAPKKTPLTGYQWRLFIFLSVATFFEGYDFFALAQVLDSIQGEFGLDKFQLTALTAFINAGTIIAYVLVRKADRWGRRQVLMVTIVGYTIFTLFSGLSTNVWMFAGFQFIARIFLIAEWATSMVIAAEEFPADRRGMVIGMIQAFSSLGAIACVGVVPVLLSTAYGWRSVYFVGVVPLMILAFARRNLKETKRFTEQVAEPGVKRSIFDIFRGPHRRRVFELGVIWFLTYACTQNAVHFWKIWAKQDPNMLWTDAQVGKTLFLAAIVSMPLIFLAGKMLDVIGRRAGAVVIYVTLAVSVVVAYTPGLPTIVLGAAMTGAVFGVTAVLAVLNAYTSELFPTDLRGDAFAWTNNLIGRIGYVLSPLMIGVLAERTNDWGAAIRPTAIFPILALALILWLLPETNQKELEETAAIGH